MIKSGRKALYFTNKLDEEAKTRRTYTRLDQKMYYSAKPENSKNSSF